MKKKLAALCAILIALTCVPLSGCSGSEDSSSSGSSSDEESSSEEATTEAPDPSLTVDGESVDTSSVVMCTVDGYDVTFDEFRYCYYYTIDNYGTTLGITADDMAEYDDDELKEHFETLIERTLNFIKSKYTYLKFANENGIALTDEEKQECQDSIDSLKEDEGDDFNTYLKNSYLTEDYLLELLEQTELSEKVSESFEISDDEFLTIAQDELYQVKNILVPYGYDLTPADKLLEQLEIDDFDSLSNSQKMNILPVTFSALDEDEQEEQMEKAKKYMQKILDKANDGEDFDELISEYGYDGGMLSSYSGGYLIGDFYTDYDSDYVEAACSLEVGEISDIIETEYGYQILKRVETDVDYIKNNLATDDEEETTEEATEETTDDTDSTASDSSTDSSDITFKAEYELMVEYKTMNELLKDITLERSDILNNLEYGDLT